MLLTNLFIMWYLVLMIVYDHFISKSQNKFKIFLYNNVYGLAGFFGLWHSWAMFSSPFTYNYNIYAKIVYRDETHDFIEVFDSSKRMFMGKKTNVFKEKMMENLLLEQVEGGIRNGFCNFLYMRDSSGKKIKEIILMRETISISPFDSEDLEEHNGIEEYYTMKADKNV